MINAYLWHSRASRCRRCRALAVKLKICAGEFELFLFFFAGFGTNYGCKPVFIGSKFKDCFTFVILGLFGMFMLMPREHVLFGRHYGGCHNALH